MTRLTFCGLGFIGFGRSCAKTMTGSKNKKTQPRHRMHFLALDLSIMQKIELIKK